MKTFSLSEPISKEYLPMAADKLGFRVSCGHAHPQEDSLLCSERHPIFVVADGVTLEPNSDGIYPDPSGAGELARLFCDAVLQAADGKYDEFVENDLRTVFAIGNAKAQAFNASHGRVKGQVNYVDFDYFAATTAFALVKGMKLYWWSLCDARVVVYGSDGGKRFHSPECWTHRRDNLPLNWTDMDSMARKKHIRCVLRNGLDENGKPIGYGVVTGEECAMNYLNTGVLDLHDGDTIIIYTDGFEDYLERKDFINLFKEWPDDLSAKLKELSEPLVQANPGKYGHERTLVACKVCL